MSRWCSQAHLGSKDHPFKASRTKKMTGSGQASIIVRKMQRRIPSTDTPQLVSRELLSKKRALWTIKRFLYPTKMVDTSSSWPYSTSCIASWVSTLICALLIPNLPTESGPQRYLWRCRYDEPGRPHGYRTLGSLHRYAQTDPHGKECYVPNESDTHNFLP
jgi:hypothetical protein